MSTPTIRLIKFGGPWCAHCVAMDKVRTLEQFNVMTPDVVLLKHDCPEDADDPIADAYSARSMPTLVFEDIASGRELARFEGGLSLTKLREIYAAAKEVQTGTRQPAKKSAKYEPRVGGYPGVQARVESLPEEPADERDSDEDEDDTED